MRNTYTAVVCKCHEKRWPGRHKHSHCRNHMPVLSVMLPAKQRSIVLVKRIARGTHRNVNYVSRLFQPQKFVPKDSKVKKEESLSKSQKLMQDLGVIHQASTGVFHLLPLGERSLQKLINIVDDEMSKINAQKLLLPLLTPGELWKITGRWEDVGEELFTLKDRHDKEYVLSPTHEESVTELMASIPQLSYRQLPLRLYQVTSKFRDEIRPRFGLLRGKEFVMKDLYTFDLSADAASETYKAVDKAYENIFRRIGIQYLRVSAASGVMGGSVSHEYHFPANIGEAQLFICESCGYAASVVNCPPSQCPECGHGFLQCCSGIEVGHTFLLGTKYSLPLKARFTTAGGNADFLQMGSYGLGMTRILAAGVEVLSLPNEMRWPTALAPFTVCIIPPKIHNIQVFSDVMSLGKWFPGTACLTRRHNIPEDLNLQHYHYENSKTCRSTLQEGSKESVVTHLAEELYYRLNSVDCFRNDLIIDNRCNMTIGKRLLEARRIGYPFIVVIGRKALQPVPEFEVYHIFSNVETSITETAIIEYLKECIFSK